MMFTTFRSSLTECYSPLPVPVSGAFESQFHPECHGPFFLKASNSPLLSVCTIEPCVGLGASVELIGQVESGHTGAGGGIH